MSEANKFLDELKNSVYSEIFTTLKAKVVKVNGVLVDAQPLNRSFPLLINLPIVSTKVKGNYMDHDLEVGDEVIVAFNNSDKSEGVVLGAISQGQEKWDNVIQGQGGTQGPPGKDGEDGISLDYNWKGTKLGIKKEDEVNFVYMDLKGDKGDRGERGMPGTDATVTKTKIITELGYEPADSNEVDKLKQSGVESNKILVDALNSKKVFASTNDSIRTNANKVNLISLGVEVDDKTESPGNLKLIYGDMANGIFGIVPSPIFIDGSRVNALAGLTEGTPFNPTTVWIKYAWQSKVCFAPLRPLRYGVSYDHLESKNVVTGDKVIYLGTHKARIRLMGTVKEEGGSVSDTHYTEYNSILLPLHERAEHQAWAFPEFVENDLPNFGYRMDNIDFGTQQVNGKFIWGKERVISENGNRISVRGGENIEYSSWYRSYNSANTAGWRPVLEIVE